MLVNVLVATESGVCSGSLCSHKRVSPETPAKLPATEIQTPANVIQSKLTPLATWPASKSRDEGK